MIGPIYTEHRSGPRPAARVGGGELADPAAIAADLTVWWADRLVTLPDGDFPRPLWLRARQLDSALRRGWLARVGAHVHGKWLYRLTELGRAVRAAVLAARA